MPEQLPLTKLIKGRWYVGRGRNGNVGFWDGHCFLVIAEKFDDFVIKNEPFYEADWGCFQPFAVVDEGQMVEPFGRVGWDKHYGRRVEFASKYEGTKATEPSQSELVGCWKGCAYLWDGVRIDNTLVLSADGTFWKSPPDPSSTKGEHCDTGLWGHDQQENLLHLQYQRPNGEVEEFSWCIMGFTGSTLLVRWLALASRNLPFLFYRVDLQVPKAQQPKDSAKAP